MFVWNKRPSAFSSKSENVKCEIIKQAFCEIRNGKCKFEMFVKVGLKHTLKHPASRAFSYGTYALYREKALHESCQVLVEHAQRVAK